MSHEVRLQSKFSLGYSRSGLCQNAFTVSKQCKSGSEISNKMQKRSIVAINDDANACRKKWQIDFNRIQSNGIHGAPSSRSNTSRCQHVISAMQAFVHNSGKGMALQTYHLRQGLGRHIIFRQGLETSYSSSSSI